MASGKASRRKRREQAQAPPPVRSKGAQAAGRPSPKVLGIAAGLIVLVALVIGLVIAFSGGSSKNSTNLPAFGSVATGLPEAAIVQQELKGIPQLGNVLGSAQAPVTMVEYVDPQCPYCQQFETQAFSHILPLVRSGKVKIEVRIVDFIGPDSQRGRAAAIAAGEQNKMFNYLLILYYNQGTENTGWLSTDMIGAAAASIPGLDVQKLLSARSSQTVTAQAKAFDAAMKKGGVNSTPTILVGKSGQAATEVALTSPSDYASVLAALKSAGA
jgi:protein-disulfide isomerase